MQREMTQCAGPPAGRGLRWARGSWAWSYFRDYFPVRLVKTAELPPDSNYLLCSYPHGIIGQGVLARHVPVIFF